MGPGRRGRGEAGFTLVEILVSIGVLAVGLVGIIQLQGMLFHSARRSDDLTQATALLERRMEEIASKGPDALSVAGAYPTCPVPGSGVFLTSQCAQCLGASNTYVRFDEVADCSSTTTRGFRIETQISAHPVASLPSARVVTVRVCWGEDRAAPVLDRCLPESRHYVQAVRVIGGP